MRLAPRWAALAFCTALFAPGAAHAASFAVFGDLPYNNWEVDAMRTIIDEMNRDDALAFVVHAGDIKSGGSRCDDDLYRARHADFDAVRHPFVFIPGDNEWTDCHRRSAGGYNPEERLAKLREIFFAGSESLGRRRMPLIRQGDLQSAYAAWRENVRWEHAGVLFVGLNLPGSNNNWKNNGNNREFNARLKANTAWLEAAFVRAAAASHAGVVLILQANPDFESDEARKHSWRPGWRDGYAEFRVQLARAARAFGRPVLVVHGDTHRYQLDRPLKDEAGESIANVTRLEVFGSPDLGWVRVTIDPVHAGLFRIQARRFGQLP
ncbi:MAG: metallophosphoesterase [Burkholderiales bacterium]